MSDFMPEINEMLKGGSFPTDLRILKIDHMHLISSFEQDMKSKFNSILQFIKLLSEKCTFLRVLHVPLQLSDIVMFEKSKKHFDAPFADFGSMNDLEIDQLNLIRQIKKLPELQELVLPVFIFTPKVLNTIGIALVSLKFMQNLTIWSSI